MVVHECFFFLGVGWVVRCVLGVPSFPSFVLVVGRECCMVFGQFGVEWCDGGGCCFVIALKVERDVGCIVVWGCVAHWKEARGRR